MAALTPAAPSALVDMLHAEASATFEPFARRWEALQGRDGVAQLRGWLRGVEQRSGQAALLLRVHRIDTCEDVLLLPLVAHREGRLAVADGGAAGLAAPAQGLETWDAAAVAALRRALREALAGHDLLRLQGMAPGAATAPLRRALHVDGGETAAWSRCLPLTWRGLWAAVRQHRRG